jgi:hypothetical protein
MRLEGFQQRREFEMIKTAEINARFARLGLGLEIRSHCNGLFYVVSLRDGKETIINSAMGLDWVISWAAQRVRDFFRVHVVNGSAYYPATGAEPVFHG